MKVARAWNVVKPIETLLLILFFVISNRVTWICIFEENRVLFSCQYGTRTDELLIYLIMLVLALWLVYRTRRQDEYWRLWRRNWPLGLFVVFTFLALFWTVTTIISAYEALWIALSALFAAYLGMRYRGGEWLRFVAYFGVASIAVSWLLLALIPDRAIHSSIGLYGAWRGAFAHKNYMGAIVAYCSAILLYLIFAERRPVWRAVAAVSYLASLGLLIGSHSATGAILFVLLNGLTAVWLACRQWGHLLRRPHYIALGLVLSALLVAAAVFRERLLAIVGRGTDFSGRFPLWSYLIGKLNAANRLWLGFGGGAPWHDWYFRITAEFDQHWPFQIINGHNGFIDVLLAFGLVGLTLFLVVVGLAIYRVLAQMRRDGDSAFWLALTLVYVIVVNITISFFFQFETFHWALLVIVLFAASKHAPEIGAAADASPAPPGMSGQSIRQ